MQHGKLLLLSLALLATAAAGRQLKQKECEYTVVAGDFMDKIAKKYGIELDALVELNPQVTDTELIYPGDVIKVPCTGPVAPSPEAATSGASIADLVSNRPDTTIVLKAAVAAGFAETLADPELVATAFIPTDAAFAALLAELNTTAEALLADTELLKMVLSYHVVPDVAAQAADLEQNQLLPTLLGDDQTLKVKLPEGRRPRLKTTSGQRVRIIETDLPAGAAVVHIVEEVLIPDAEPGSGSAPTPGAAPGPISGCEYTVVEGDYFYSIAERAGLSLKQAKELNPQIKNFNKIYPGDKIILC